MIDLEAVKRRIQTARELAAEELDFSGSRRQKLSLLIQPSHVAVLRPNFSVDLTELPGRARLCRDLAFHPILNET